MLAQRDVGTHYSWIHGDYILITSLVLDNLFIYDSSYKSPYNEIGDFVFYTYLCSTDDAL